MSDIRSKLMSMKTMIEDCLTSMSNPDKPDEEPENDSEAPGMDAVDKPPASDASGSKSSLKKALAKKFAG